MYMAMLVALTLAFPSCNVEMELGNNTLEYRERTAYLCSYDWQDDWYDDYGLHHFQVLRFYTNGTGEDFIRIQDARGVGRNIPTPLRGTGTTLSTPASV